MAQIFPIDFEEKLTMAQDDYILFSDSEDGNKIKKAQYKNLKGEKGNPGQDGADGAAATITVGTTTTGAAGTSASVTNSGTSSAAVFNFTIPQGAKGETGADGKDGTDGKDGADGTSATITVGTTTTLPAGSSATVENVGTSQDAILNFGIPKGDGSGDVNGPASSTDDNIATFDGATGKLIQDSGVSISDINTKTFTLSSTSDLTNAQAALDWYLNGGNPILYHERGYTSAPMPCTYHLRETIYRNSNYEYVFVSPAGNWDVENLEWTSESDTIFHCIGLSVADVNDEPGDTVLSIREFDIKGSDYFAKKADASKIEYVTQAEYNALLPGAESDGKHYFIYSTSGGGGWQPGVNTIAYYPLDTDFNDASGNSRNLTNSGATITTVGDISCGYWDGSATTYYQGFSLTREKRTISMWMRGIATNDNVGLQIAKRSSGFAGALGIMFYSGVLASADGAGAGTSGVSASTNTWYYAVSTQEGSVVNFYVNGVLIGTESNRPDYSTRIPDGWSLGSQNNTGAYAKLNGYMSNVILEDKVWTAQEVADYYNLTKGDYGIS